MSLGLKLSCSGGGCWAILFLFTLEMSNSFHKYKKQKQKRMNEWHAWVRYMDGILRKWTFSATFQTSAAFKYFTWVGYRNNAIPFFPFYAPNRLGNERGAWGLSCKTQCSIYCIILFSLLICSCQQASQLHVCKCNISHCTHIYFAWKALWPRNVIFVYDRTLFRFQNGKRYSFPANLYKDFRRNISGVGRQIRFQ